MTAYDVQSIALWCVIALAAAASLYSMWQTRQRCQADTRMAALLVRAELMVDQLEGKERAQVKSLDL